MVGQSVLFDMDGLLLDTELICLETFIETGYSFGLPDMSKLFLKTIGLRGAESTPVIAEGLAGRVGHDEYCSHWQMLIDKRVEHEIPVKSGVLSLLKALKAHDCSLAIATSTKTARAVSQLEQVEIAHYFDKIIGGERVSNGKPDPEIYHLAASELGVKTSDCFIFEDSDTGILAAVRSGGKAVQIPDLKQPSAQTVALGHIIAPDLMAGARAVGLID